MSIKSELSVGSIRQVWN